MDLIYAKRAQADREYGQKYHPKIIERIEKLIIAIKENPFCGLGKPEPLKFEKSGYWSRRIDQEHRLVYKIANNKLYIAQCRYHY